MSDTSMTMADYIEKFPLIADQIRETLDDYGKELDQSTAPEAEIMGSVMVIMVEVAKVQALQAIALGIQELVNKENSL